MIAQKWPTDYLLHVWLPPPPASIPLSSSPPSSGYPPEKTPHPPPPPPPPPATERISLTTSPSISDTQSSSRFSTNWIQKGCRFFHPSSAYCSSIDSRAVPPCPTTVSTTALAQRVPMWVHEEFGLVGFKLVLQRYHSGTLRLTVWPAATISKTLFIKHGYVHVQGSI